jgi:hypothetical protein
MEAPMLAVGDGALGFWGALGDSAISCARVDADDVLDRVCKHERCVLLVNGTGQARPGGTDAGGL